MPKDIDEEITAEALNHIASDSELLSSALQDHCLTNDCNEMLSFMFTQSRPEVRAKFLETFKERLVEYAFEKEMI